MAAPHPGFGDANRSSINIHPAGPSRAGLDPHGAIAHWPDAKIGPGALQRAKGTSEGWGWVFFHVFDCDGQKNVGMDALDRCMKVQIVHLGLSMICCTKVGQIWMLQHKNECTRPLPV